MKPLKSPTHIHFWRKIFMDSRQFFALWFWDFAHTLYAYYAERKFCHKYTRALSPVWNRPPIRALYARKISPQIYMRNCGAFGIRARLIGCWYLCVRLYHVFIYVVVVWIRTFLLIGWCQNWIVKAWLDCINSL